MEGIILFADDEIHKIQMKGNNLQRSNENALYDSLCEEFPVLGVKNLDEAEKCINSVANFSAIILDWQYKEDLIAAENGDDDETIGLITPPSTKTNRTLKFLEENEIYSLIYIYSNENVQAEFGTRLKAKYGKRIQIKKKTNIDNPKKAKSKIIADITKWKEKNENLVIPLKWSNTINKSTQKIFKELSDTNANWIKEIYDSASQDGMDEALFVIEIFQQLLSENLIQSKELIDAIKEFAKTDTQDSDDLAIARLFRRLYYSKISENAPIMTGDICQISRNKFGIIMTPECDTGDVCKSDNLYFDLFVFEKAAFDNFLIDYQSFGYNRNLHENWSTGNEKQRKKISKLLDLFNQKETKYHILPSFPFNIKLNMSAIIDFSTNLEKHKSTKVKKYKRSYKLNSPFIQQLRQRYISHLGRIGVPALPFQVRSLNLK